MSPEKELLNFIISTPFQNFQKKHLNSNEIQWLTQFKKSFDIEASNILEHIKAQKKASKKLASINTNNWIFPSQLSIEQCSSELAASYKSSIISNKTHILDLSGGLGIDTLAFAQKCKKLDYVEQNKWIYLCAQHNHQQNNLNHIKHFNASAEDFTQSQLKQYDLIYIDPARRGHKGERVFGFEDCSPNILEILPILNEHKKECLIKASPMIDISRAIEQIANYCHIHIISINDECKEILFHVHPELSEHKIICKDLNKHYISFESEFDNKGNITYSQPLLYIYEPATVIRKAKKEAILAEKLGLMKLHPNTGLYTSDKLHISYPGKIHQLTGQGPLNKKYIKESFSNKAVRVVSKNHPSTAADIRRKFKLKEGEHHTLFATQILNDKKIVLNCQQVFPNP